jgi:phosphoribosylanthranilate isomerase
MTKVKICGIKSLPDALAAIDAGADLLGFNFYPKSVRFVEMQTCARITSVLKKAYPGIQLVGVFVNLTVHEIKFIMNVCSLDLAQLHGDESPEFCAALGDQAYKAFRGVPGGELGGYARGAPPAFLLDGKLGGSYGGTGMPADWSAAAWLAKRYRLLLAGGLNPENVVEAVQQVRPWGVDVASGLEARPGEKDAGRMKAFVEAVRSVQVKAEI